MRCSTSSRDLWRKNIWGGWRVPRPVRAGLGLRLVGLASLRSAARAGMCISGTAAKLA